MGRDLDDIQTAVRSYASGFDAASLTPAEAQEVVTRCARIESSIASVRALAAARAAESGTWKQEGFRSAADKMAADTGTTPAAARRAISTGQRLADQPDVAQAALSGELSSEQAEAVADGASANPGKAAELITKAKSSSLSELNDEVARVKAAATDLEERRRRLHARRSLQRWTDREGAFHAHLFGHPEDGARIWRAIDPIRRRLNLLRRQAGVKDTFEALDYDALVLLTNIAAGIDGELSFAELCELGLFPQRPQDLPSPAPGPSAPTDDAHSPTLFPDGPGDARAPAGLFPAGPGDARAPAALFPAGLHVPAGLHHAGDAGPADDTDQAPPSSGHGPPPLPAGGAPATSRRSKKLAGRPVQIQIRVNLDTLLRGVPLEGEVCEIVGYGPVAVSVIEQLAAQENAFIVGVITLAEKVLSVYHHRRRPNTAQRSGLDFLQPTCVVAGCNVKAGLQYDHRVDWAKTHYTVFDFVDRLCPHHHNLKTRQHWALVDGTGKRPLVPPTDPRHPGAPAATPDEPP